MIILTQLQATSQAGELREPRGVLTDVHCEPVKGVHLKVSLGSAGLFVRRGEVIAAYPLAELVNLAATHCPELLALAPRPPT